MPRKVLEVFPSLHERVADEAHEAGVRVTLMSNILVAYALEHLDDAIASADRLLPLWDRPPTRQPRIHIVRSVDPHALPPPPRTARKKPREA